MTGSPVVELELLGKKTITKGCYRSEIQILTAGGRPVRLGQVNNKTKQNEKRKKCIGIFDTRFVRAIKV